MIGKKNKLMIMAGGTGGHVFPGLTIALYLIKEGWQVRWLGAKDCIEARLVPQYGISIDFIRIQGFRGKNIKIKIMAPIFIFFAVFKAYRIMRFWRPDVVLGMGSYVSGPGCLAAWISRIPIILHEQNRIAGFTNRWLAKIACKVLQAFPNTLPYADVVGNPIRPDILSIPEPHLRQRNRIGPIRVLVTGGSQGSRVLNQIIPKVVARLSGRLEIWHQVGKGALSKVNEAYIEVGELNHRIVEFIENIDIAYSWADFVICRAGALTVSEIMAAGLPSLLVPFMHKDRHQYWNALSLEQVGSAIIVEEPEFTIDRVITILSKLNRTILLEMARNARKIVVSDATEKIAKVVQEIKE